jgi:hypothetical protein
MFLPKKTGNNTKLYGILEVEPTATDDEIKRAYKKMALKVCHLSYLLYTEFSFDFEHQTSIPFKSRKLISIQYHPDKAPGQEEKVHFLVSQNNLAVQRDKPCV